jgi:type II secretory pathway pseudopilin PulG
MRASLRNENGVAMPVTTWMLLVVSLLVTAFFAVSLQLSDTTDKDRSQKRALAAAEAGLQTAVHRLNLIRTPPVPANMCMTHQAVSPLTGGECPPSTVEQLGNGSSVYYYVTPEGEDCLDLPVPSGTSSTDRCVTSVGIANGVQRRLQVRVANTPGPPSFTQIGAVGKSLFAAGNSSKIWSDIGTNGEGRFGNSAETFTNSAIDITGSLKLGPGGSYVPEPGTSGQNIRGGVENVPAFTLPEDDFEAPEIGARNVLESSVRTHLGSRYTHATRTFSMASGTYTFLPGTYHFCRVHLGNSVELKFHATLPTKIYVDSPDRPGTVCAAGSGTFTADNSVKINLDAGHEELLDIYMYGTLLNDIRPRYTWCDPQGSPQKPEECRSDFMLDNSVEFKGVVSAPNTTVQTNNSVKWWGAVGADKIRFNNSIEFTLTDAVKNRPSGSQGAAERAAWGECRPQPDDPNNPESGC